MPNDPTKTANLQQPTSHVVRNGRRVAIGRGRAQAPVPYIHPELRNPPPVAPKSPSTP